MTYGEITTRVIDAHTAHPDYTANDLAFHLGMKPGTVRGIAARARLTLPSENLKQFLLKAAAERKPFVRRPYAGKSDGDNNKW